MTIRRIHRALFTAGIAVALCAGIAVALCAGPTTATAHIAVAAPSETGLAGDTGSIAELLPGTAGSPVSGSLPTGSLATGSADLPGAPAFDPARDCPTLPEGTPSCAQPGDVVEVSASMLHPTQPAVGMDQIDYKLGRYTSDKDAARGKPNKRFDDYCEDNGRGEAVPESVTTTSTRGGCPSTTPTRCWRCPGSPQTCPSSRPCSP